MSNESRHDLDRSVIHGKVPSTQAADQSSISEEQSDTVLLLPSTPEASHHCVHPPESFVFHPPNTWICAYDGKSLPDWIDWHRPPHWPSEPECIRTCWICTGLRGIVVERGLDGVFLDSDKEKAKWVDGPYRSFEDSLQLREHIEEEHPGYCKFCQTEIGEGSVLEVKESKSLDVERRWSPKTTKNKMRASNAGKLMVIEGYDEKGAPIYTQVERSAAHNLPKAADITAQDPRPGSAVTIRNAGHGPGQLPSNPINSYESYAQAPRPYYNCWRCSFICDRLDILHAHTRDVHKINHPPSSYDYVPYRAGPRLNENIPSSIYLPLQDTQPPPNPNFPQNPYMYYPRAPVQQLHWHPQPQARHLNSHQQYPADLSRHLPVHSYPYNHPPIHHQAYDQFMYAQNFRSTIPQAQYYYPPTPYIPQQPFATQYRQPNQGYISPPVHTSGHTSSRPPPQQYLPLEAFQEAYPANPTLRNNSHSPSILRSNSIRGRYHHLARGRGQQRHEDHRRATVSNRGRGTSAAHHQNRRQNLPATWTSGMSGRRKNSRKHVGRGFGDTTRDGITSPRPSYPPLSRLPVWARDDSFADSPIDKANPNKPSADKTPTNSITPRSNDHADLIIIEECMTDRSGYDGDVDSLAKSVGQIDINDVDKTPGSEGSGPLIERDMGLKYGGDQINGQKSDSSDATKRAAGSRSSKRRHRNAQESRGVAASMPPRAAQHASTVPASGKPAPLLDTNIRWIDGDATAGLEKMVSKDRDP